MTKVLEIIGKKEEKSTIEYKCILESGKQKWLKKENIINFNDVPNPYKVNNNSKQLEKIIETTRKIYEFLINDKEKPGIKMVIKRGGIRMFIRVNDAKEVEVIYKKDQIEKLKLEIVEFYENHIILENKY